MSLQSVHIPVVVTGWEEGQVEMQFPLYKYKPNTQVRQTEAELQVVQFTLHRLHWLLSK